MSIFKNLFKNLSTRIWLCVTIPLLVGILVGNILATTWLAPLFDVFSPPPAILGENTQKQTTLNKAEARAAAETLSQQIVEEGVVLLKNSGGLPIGKNAKVSVFGKNSINLVYGGSGSGGGDHAGAKTIFDCLTEAGLTYNTVLKGFYENDSRSGDPRTPNPKMESGGAKTLNTGETPQSRYTDTEKSSYNSFNDAALIVLSRIGGEDWDLPRAGGHPAVNANNPEDHYLQLDKNEIDLIKAVCDAGFPKVVVILNSNNPLELGFLDDPTCDGYDSRLNACLWIGSPGDAGIMGLGKILNGDVSPSGKTVDTYSRHFKNDPTWVNFGHNPYSNNGTEDIRYTYVDYMEDIYVGYRYFETRGFIEAQNGNDAWYGENVVYPFGHGLSYTTFAQEIVAPFPAATLTKDKFTLNVKVTNTGETYKAKDAVQVYVTAPSTGIAEKSHVVLAGFAKTPEIAPGASLTVPVEIDPYLFASYDSVTSECFVLDAGDYVIKIGKNAHNMYADSRTMNVPTRITYKNGVKTEVENRYADAEAGLLRKMSKSNFEGTFPEARTFNERVLTTDLKAQLDDRKTNNPLNVPAADYPKVGQPGELTFDDMVAAPFDDPRWEAFLDRLTIREMTTLVTDGQFKTAAIERLGIPATTIADGPFGFVNFMGKNIVYGCCYFASEVVLASTWNTKLAYEMGIAAGTEALVGNENGDGLPYSGWYAPGVNIHRSPFGGRLGEYYSEDPIMSGKMAAEMVKGARSKGVITFAKHFALNEQETNRIGVATWITEQALREVYLRPFELAVKEGETMGIMSSFNRIGTRWTGGDYRLITEILRNEWGFKGMVVCDYFTDNALADSRQMIYSGNDLHIMAVTARWFSPDNSDATDIVILRTAAKNILYAVANSNITDYDIVGYGLASWRIVIIIVDVVVVLCLGAWGFFAIRYSNKKRKS